METYTKESAQGIRRQETQKLRNEMLEFLPTKVMVRVQEDSAGLVKFVWTPEVYSNAKEIFKKIHNKYKPTCVFRTVGTERKIIQSPFRIDIKKKIFKNEIHHFASINFNHGNMNFNVLFGLDEIKEHISENQRHLFDSEYSQFEGITYYQLRNKTFKTFSFNSNSIKWTGGESTLTDPNTINLIVDKILSHE